MYFHSEHNIVHVTAAKRTLHSDVMNSTCHILFWHAKADG